MGASLSALLASAYVAGGAARAGTDQTHLQQLAKAAATGFSDQALRQGMAPGVLAIAERYDPALVPAAGGSAGGINPWIHALPQPEDGASAVLQKAELTQPAAASPFNGRTNASDADCLATAVYYEARGEGQAGQAAVAQVILNRVRHPAYPKTICGVVYQAANGDCQFSFVCDGSMRARRESAAWTRARRVADRALGGFVMTGVGNAVNFHATRVAPGWSGMIRVAQIGQHVFYGFGGRTSLMRTFPSSAPHAFVRAPAEHEAIAPAHVASAEPHLILAAATSTTTVDSPAGPAPSSTSERTAGQSAATAPMTAASASLAPARAMAATATS